MSESQIFSKTSKRLSFQNLWNNLGFIKSLNLSHMLITYQTCLIYMHSITYASKHTCILIPLLYWAYALTMLASLFSYKPPCTCSHFTHTYFLMHSFIFPNYHNHIHLLKYNFSLYSNITNFPIYPYFFSYTYLNTILHSSASIISVCIHI